MSEETAPTPAATGYAPASGTSAVPITKVLAIGRWTEQGTPSARLPIRFAFTLGTRVFGLALYHGLCARAEPRAKALSYRIGYSLARFPSGL
jgi:hypothetical protein